MFLLHNILAIIVSGVPLTLIRRERGGSSKQGHFAIHQFHSMLGGSPVFFKDIISRSSVLFPINILYAIFGFLLSLTFRFFGFLLSLTLWDELTYVRIYVLRQILTLPKQLSLIICVLCQLCDVAYYAKPFPYSELSFSISRILRHPII